MNLQGGDRFFFDFDEEEGFLSNEESHHLLNVLRKKKGETIKLINGKGLEFEGKILDIYKKGKHKQAKVKIIRLLRKEKSPSKYIIAFIPLLKGDKTEFLIEKGTELGINKFIPFYSDFSIVQPSNTLQKRLRKKAINALKQSGRLFLPEIISPVNFMEFLSKNSLNNSLKCWGVLGKNINLYELINKLKKAENVVIVSGPEGGFSQREEKLLLEKNFLPVSLCPYVLKAETASLGLMSLFSFLIFQN